ncbi:hypothetical protein [Kosakonia cowanii]|uniref:hypothetical protein n=1 Tax=Kosakonia cowanii TaxID=208223 RepID=UPI001CEF70D7|nr:hypothetical protein [Kosakonia cowanii]
MIQQRQNIENVKNQAEQLNYLMRAIHSHHEDFESVQLDVLLGLAYNLSSCVLLWTEKEEEIVLSNEEAERECKKHG